MKNIFLFLFVFLTVTTSQAASWKTDSAKSKIAFSGQHAGKDFTGEFKKWAAQIEFDADHLEAFKVAVEIDTASLETGSSTYDAALPQKEWLDTKAYPKILFAADHIRKLSGDAYEAEGKLTIRDVQKDVKLPLTLVVNGQTAVMTSKLTINRLDYNVGKAADPDAEWVAKDIAIDLKVQASH